MKIESAIGSWLLALVLVVAGAADLWGQAAGGGQAPPVEDGEVSEGHPAFWQADLNGGHYMVKLGNIVSASKHEYVVDGAARVVEVTIGTNTSLAARFYFIEPLGKDSPLAMTRTAIERAQQVAERVGERAGESVSDRVVKNYPNSTHAHTVEWSVASEGQLNSLYASLTRAIARGRGEAWSGR
jgi:hypothetical protein